MTGVVSPMQLLRPMGLVKMTVASGIIAFGIKEESVHSRGLHLQKPESYKAVKSSLFRFHPVTECCDS